MYSQCSKYVLSVVLQVKFKQQFLNNNFDLNAWELMPACCSYRGQHFAVVSYLLM